MNLIGLAMDWIERFAEATDDPEDHAVGRRQPQYALTDAVTFSREDDLHVYHLDDDQLGQGSSLGNARCWAETKGNGDLLDLYSVEVGECVVGGFTVGYLLPFSDLSETGTPGREAAGDGPARFARAYAASTGQMHLHPAFQQRRFVIGDGLYVLETFFVPRRGDDDPAAACTAVLLRNRTPHPLGIALLASIDLRGRTARDLRATYDEKARALVAWNESQPDWVRVAGADGRPDGYWVTTDEEGVLRPRGPLPNAADDTGDLIGALQFNVLLMPGQEHKIRFVTAFSPHGREVATRAFLECSGDGRLLRDTVEHYRGRLGAATLDGSDRLVSQAVQWAKSCLVRPLATYLDHTAITNDPGNSSHLVGRDLAWFVHGCDWVAPEVSCSILDLLAEQQRDDGLIPEYIDGLTGETEDHGFNVNDNTPLFIMAAAHHCKATGHEHCLERLSPPAERAGELLLAQRDERGLLVCTARGQGAKGICGWRNVLQNETINGAVTEVNSEAHAALCSLGDLAQMRGDAAAAERWRGEAARLRTAINEHLIDPSTGLYVRNIDLEGRTYTQATVDLAFPLICGVADAAAERAVSERLMADDFLTEAGIRVLPEQNPRWDPSKESGCLGGVWPGATWWFAMSARRTQPDLLADCLRRSYWHYVADPKTFNTVPGQFSEWSDGLTLVNRGMRLSPWEPPRFLWAAIEGLAGVSMRPDGVDINPVIPRDWRWLRVDKLPYQGRELSFFAVREGAGAADLRLFTASSFGSGHAVERYEEELDQGAESIVTGLSSPVFRRDGEVLLCFGSTRDQPALGAFLAHHALSTSHTYQVRRLLSTAGDWEDLGRLEGSRLQRMTVEIEAQGYALFHCRRVDD